MVERAVGWETVRHETVDHLVPELYRRAVDEIGVEPVGDPELDLGELERDKPLKFTATVTVKPEVDLRDYLSIRVPMETTEITEENVDEAIQEARRRHAELVEVDRAAQAGDVIKCTLVMRRGDEMLTRRRRRRARPRAEPRGGHPRDRRRRDRADRGAVAHLRDDAARRTTVRRSCAAPPSRST